jgi:hypothetical protein
MCRTRLCCTDTHNIKMWDPGDGVCKQSLDSSVWPKCSTALPTARLSKWLARQGPLTHCLDPLSRALVEQCMTVHSPSLETL